MKTIQISDETYDFIKNLAQEMKEQNNRWTQNVGFIIRSKDRDYICDEWMFFTAKACNELIEARRYAYSENARSYGISNRRNDEMCKLQRVIFELAGIEKPTDY